LTISTVQSRPNFLGAASYLYDEHLCPKAGTEPGNDPRDDRGSSDLMKSFEIMEHISPRLAVEILGYLQKEQTSVFKSTVQTLAGQRKLRPIFVERRPPAERYAWIKDALSRKPVDALAAHVLQNWLLGTQKEMLCDFLDSLGIAHEADGTVEQLPESPSKEELERAVDQLLAKYPAENVAVYLQAFYDMDTTVTWPALGELLTQDQRLRLSPDQS